MHTQGKKEKPLAPALGQTLGLIILIMITNNCVILAQVALSSNQLWLAKKYPESISSGQKYGSCQFIVS
jgi:Na+-translocating ferredoxin:NAD+ oxidoreductase RnfA subunit